MSYAADNAILKNRAENIECSFGCVARSTVLLKPNAANISLFNFLKFVQHVSITISIDCNGLSLLIFEAKWPNYASGSKSAPNSDFFGCVGFSMYAGFLCLKCYNFACLHTSQEQNELHLIRCYFFAKIGIFYKSVAGPLSSVVQSYTQKYSFGGRLKLIICQIRHVVSVNIYEISTS